ncbi:MAG: response regulator transcription factor [Acidobacteriota bacterium]
MKPPTVLIADDDPMIHLILGGNMKAAGWTVHQAMNGKQAVNAARHQAFDAIVLDVRMPGLDGVAAARELRAAPINSTVPIILISAAYDDDARLNGFFAGVDDFIPKPFRARELVERITSVWRYGHPAVGQDATAVQEDLTLWIDVDPAGRVLAASPAALEAFELPPVPRGVDLAFHLGRLHSLLPADPWAALATPIESGFCRLMTRLPDTGGLETTFEVLVEPRALGCRLVFEDIRGGMVDARWPGATPIGS